MEVTKDGLERLERLKTLEVAKDVLERLKWLKRLKTSLLEPSSDLWLKPGVVLKPLGVSVLVNRSGLSCTSDLAGVL